MEPLALAEGTRVSVSFTERNGEPEGAAGVAEAGEPQRTPAEILAENAAQSVRHGEVETAGEDHDQHLDGVRKKFADALAEIAALPLEGKGDRFSGRDHDQVLYGGGRAK